MNMTEFSVKRPLRVQEPSTAERHSHSAPKTLVCGSAVFVCAAQQTFQGVIKRSFLGGGAAEIYFALPSALSNLF
jgi:hypothetical protein